MSLHPARDEAIARKMREEIELCGKNRGPHDYIPIEWFYTKDEKGIEYQRVSRFICRVCFKNVNTGTLIKMYKDISDDLAQNHDTSG
jgi:hypothetical protein